MKNLLYVLLGLCVVIGITIAGDHDMGVFNVDRIMFGSSNGGVDTNPTKDITGSKGNYISNDTSGVWTISGTRLVIQGDISQLDSLLAALVLKSTLKVLGTVTAVGEVDVGGNVAIIGNIDSVNNITKLDSIISKCVVKNAFKVIGPCTLSNVANVVSGTVDSIKSDVVLSADSARIYKDTFGKWVPQALNGASGAGNYNMQIQCGTVTYRGGDAGDTITFHAAYAADPVVVATIECIAGAETLYTVNIDSVGLTAAYLTFRQIAPKVTGQIDSLQVTEKPAKNITTHWISIGK